MNDKDLQEQIDALFENVENINEDVKGLKLYIGLQAAQIKELNKRVDENIVKPNKKSLWQKIFKK